MSHSKPQLWAFSTPLSGDKLGGRKCPHQATRRILGMVACPSQHSRFVCGIFLKEKVQHLKTVNVTCHERHTPSQVTKAILGLSSPRGCLSVLVCGHPVLCDLHTPESCAVCRLSLLVLAALAPGGGFTLVFPTPFLHFHSSPPPPAPTFLAVLSLRCFLFVDWLFIL